MFHLILFQLVFDSAWLTLLCGDKRAAIKAGALVVGVVLGGLGGGLGGGLMMSSYLLLSAASPAFKWNEDHVSKSIDGAG